VSKHHRPRPGAHRPDPLKIAALPRATKHETIAAVMADRKAQAASGATIIQSIDLTPKGKQRKDQGQSGSCTAHSLSVVLYLAQVTAGVAAPVDPSEHCLYSLSGRLENASAAPDVIPDNGRQLTTCLGVVASPGIGPQGTSPDGRNSDIWTAGDLAYHNLAGPPANVSLDLTPAETAALVPMVLDVRTIDPAAADMEETIQAALIAGAAVYLGTEVGSAFQNVTDDTEPMPDADPNDPQGGGHALALVGFRPAPDGGVEYKIDNSWGSTAWGDAGECYVSVAWLRNCWELHAVFLAKP